MEKMFGGSNGEQENALMTALINAADGEHSLCDEEAVYAYLETTPKTSFVVELIQELNKLGYKITNDLNTKKMETQKSQPITWQQLKEFVNSIPVEKLKNTAHIVVEDDAFSKPLLEPYFMDKDIYVNKYESEDFGNLEDLKEVHNEDFNINNYELITAAGTPFLWAE